MNYLLMKLYTSHLVLPSKIQLIAVILFLSLGFSSCKSGKRISSKEPEDFTIAFGSCYDQKRSCPLWGAILDREPDVWIWGGDNVYADSDDSIELWSIYKTLLDDKDYIALRNEADIVATWDDHDYGLNDGGEEFHAKDMSKRLFLKFLDADKNDDRYHHGGVYSKSSYKVGKKNIDIIALDTRYFRTALTPSTIAGRRYDKNTYGEGSLLGKEQWAWLDKTLGESRADLTFIVSSIQFLSTEHGFETWGNFPHEIDHLYDLIRKYKKPGVILLSGDRHISEFSVDEPEGIPYPIMDFTSSGLTHTYEAFSGENNPKRKGEVYNVKSFGVIEVAEDTDDVRFIMVDENNQVLSSYRINYALKWN